ncbi:uncharacterized protein LOC130744950 [Lotus japonicus]|uniref:uncharacterized protein LOC130744950 n=1 Tax=Lotus japonicus TaxID=34305 RepID=UPI00258FE3CB|nr:uncharacterized protein LOC130744950 [Lotus japonicus]
MAHLVTRSQLARVTRFLLRSTPSLHRGSRTTTFAQCSTATADSSRRAQAEFDRSPPMLPVELSRNVLFLSCESSAEGGVCDVYVLGTCHVSEAVFLELCWRRRGALTRKTLKVPTERDIIAALKNKHNIFEVLLGWLYAKIGSELGVIPGSEFRVAYEEANKYGGRVALGDRPIQITLKRTWSKMPLLHKTKLLCYCLFPPFLKLSGNFDDLIKIGKMLKHSDRVNINELLNDNELINHCIQILSKEFPTAIETIVDERDQYMSSRLLKFASQRRSVVAVVGKGHLEGIRKYWKQPVAEDLLTVPSSKPGPATRLLKMLIDYLVLFWLLLEINRDIIL